MAGFRRLYPIGLLLGLLAVTPDAGAAPPAYENAVDLELVLAVDVSGSIDEEEAALQRAGYVRALADPRVAAAIQAGFIGRIAVTYVEWAGPAAQAQLLGWEVIDGPESAQRFAARLADATVGTAQYTSISSVIDFGTYLLSTNDYEGTRRVIDISGDGPNNTGLPVTLARDAAVAEGITINGLPILNGKPNRYGFPQLADLDRYYVECVIGGPGAFIEVALGFEDFAETVLRKLLLEIAGVTPAPRVWRAVGEDAYDCLVGERQLRRYFERDGLY